MTLLLNLGTVAFMVAVDIAICLVIRAYEKRGIILALPRPTYREQTPKLFRIQIALLWLSLILCVGFTVLMSTLLLVN